MNVLETNGCSLEMLAVQIETLCEEIHQCRTEAERREEGADKKQVLVELTDKGRKVMNISSPGLLLALMDAYEITQDENMLQDVLNVVSKDLCRLAVTAQSVKLLAYCYYYVEAEECARKAKEILDELRQGGNEKEIESASRIYKEFVGN